MGYKAAVITISDKGFVGERKDTSGPSLCKILSNEGYEIIYTNILPDEKEMIKDELTKVADTVKADLILTTGGTGFSPRDITPEATKAIIDRETPGIPELMRAESCKITNRGCLSRSAAGIRGNCLIVNLPGSEKASKENLEAVLPALDHGLQMLQSQGSANCAENNPAEHTHHHAQDSVKKESPSMDAWKKEAKLHPDASKVGMYLVHNGIVRETPKAVVRNGENNDNKVSTLFFSYDEEKVEKAIEETYKMEGIYYIKTWLNSGELNVGDDIMYVMIGGDIRPRVIDALQFLVGKIKNECVIERENY